MLSLQPVKTDELTSGWRRIATVGGSPRPSICRSPLHSFRQGAFAVRGTATRNLKTTAGSVVLKKSFLKEAPKCP